MCRCRRIAKSFSRKKFGAMRPASERFGQSTHRAWPDARCAGILHAEIFQETSLCQPPSLLAVSIFLPRIGVIVGDGPRQSAQPRMFLGLCT